MHLRGAWHVTNLIDDPLLLLKAYLTRPRADALWFCVSLPDVRYGHRYPILPKQTGTVSVNFVLQPLPCKGIEDFKARVVLVDQFGKKHKTPTAVFHCDKSTKRRKGCADNTRRLP